MIWHLFQSGVKDDVLNLFEELKGKTYQSKKGMKRLLNKLGLQAKEIRQHCMEAGLVGFITSTILKPGHFCCLIELDNLLCSIMLDAGCIWSVH